MKNALLRTAIAGLFAASAFGASAADLMQIYRDAVSQDPVFASARAAYEAAKEGKPIARATILPSLTLTGNANRINSDSTLGGRDSSSNYTSKAYSLTLTQPLFRMQSWLAVDQADLQVKQAEAVFADAKQSIVSRAAQAYFDVLLAQDNVALSGAQKKAVEESLAQAKRNFEVGTSTIVDTYEAQARFDLAVAREIADRNDLEVKKSALEHLIGKRAPALARLKENPELVPPSPADPDKWIAGAHEASPTVAQARAAFEIAAKEVSRTQAGHYPTLDLTGSYGYNNAPSSGIPFNSTTTNVGLVLSIPLYQGGGQQARVRQALSSRERAEQDLENAKRAVAQLVRTSYLGVTSGAAQVKAFEASLVSSKSSLDSTLLGKEVGVRTNVDVLNSQQQLFQTRRDLQQARYNTILAQLRLKAAAGRLTEDDLAEINRLLAR
ncbi:MAG: TolC family outer membrane protein [Burkholderiales bacterium]